MKLFFQSKRWAKLFITDDAPNKDGERYSQTTLGQDRTRFYLKSQGKKLFNFLLTFTFMLTISSCKEDEPQKSPNQHPLIGRWLVTHMSQKKMSQKKFSPPEEISLWIPIDGKLYQEFKPDSSLERLIFFRI